MVLYVDVESCLLLIIGKRLEYHADGKVVKNIVDLIYCVES